MAIIKLIASGELSIPSRLSCWLKDKPWPGGGTVPILNLTVGQDQLEIYPADPDRMRELAKKLNELADELEKKR